MFNPIKIISLLQMKEIYLINGNNDLPDLLVI
jgi:hypothetical protein